MSELKWPSSPPVITDGALRLRGWDSKDADAVYSACQDAAIQRWTTVPVPYRPEDASAFIGEYAPGLWAAQTGGPLAVVAADSDEVLGACGLVAVDTPNLVGEIGYWVAPWARGLGVAPHAARMVADWAFNDVGFKRIELYIEPANTASCAVAEKLGCEREGVLRRKTILRDEPRDMVLYSLVKP